MLSKYQELQQTKLADMLSQQAQTKRQTEQEQQRLLQLQQHIQNMELNNQMQCALGLQNLANMKHILQGLSQQQASRVEQLEGDHARQHQACVKQLSFTKGLDGVLEKRRLQYLHTQQQQQQKQLDELINQAVIKQQRM